MRKNPLPVFRRRSGKTMHSVATAQTIARKLVHDESRGSGDTDNAMRRLSRRYDIPHSLLWALRYRPPHDILHGAWMRLMDAYEVECSKQERRYAAERLRTRALKHAANQNLVRAADLVAGKKNGAA